MRTVKQVSDLTGISVRTLHYYDEVGLLKPSAITDTGYRLYDDEALQTLQQILFFKELDIPQLISICNVIIDYSFVEMQMEHVSHLILLKIHNSIEFNVNSIISYSAILLI